MTPDDELMLLASLACIAACIAVLEGLAVERLYRAANDWLVAAHNVRTSAT